MKITKRPGPPEDLVYFDDELDLKEKDVEDVVEIFNTPLTGSYNWDYTVAENRIKKLYELGKELNWNGSIDLDWSYNHPKDEKLLGVDGVEFPHEQLDAYKALSDEEKIEFDRHETAEVLCQFLHGEQGALLVASQSPAVLLLSMQKCTQLHKLLMRLGTLKFLIDICKKK